jgi:predicted N-acetyltransferase YhbS
MTWAEATGLDALQLTVELLHRVRLADPVAGRWEAADFCWWWRTPQRSDALAQRFWIDDHGPVAAAPLTEWTHGWGLDPIAFRGSAPDVLERVLDDSLARVAGLGLERVETLVRDDDSAMVRLLVARGFRSEGDSSGITWMDARDRPAVPALADGFVLEDRVARPEGIHPAARRSGPETEARLRQTVLYDPTLDLAIRTDDGEVAGYALFWFDPETHVGLLEPMRVEDAWQRRGLARALLATGLDRLATKGATRLKVGWGSPPGRALYLGAGFREEATATTYGRSMVTAGR